MRSCKLVLLGRASVGKTALLNRLRHNRFRYTETTLGAAFSVLHVLHQATPAEFRLLSNSEVADLPSSDVVRVEVWDTAGQERFAALLPMYYRNADAVLVVHDGSGQALKSASTIIDTVLQAQDAFSTQPLIQVMQNKSDLGWSVPDRTLDTKFDKRLLNPTAHVSAKTGENVAPAFYQLLFAAVQRIPPDAPLEPDNGVIDLSSSGAPSRCCFR